MREKITRKRKGFELLLVDYRSVPPGLFGLGLSRRALAAYVSDESGGREICIRGFPDPRGTDRGLGGRGAQRGLDAIHWPASMSAYPLSNRSEYVAESNLGNT